MLTAAGVTVRPFVLNYTTPAADIILAIMAAEAAANFDFWQRSGADDTNRRQDFWPPLLRLARMIPAVEYIQVGASTYLVVPAPGCEGLSTCIASCSCGSRSGYPRAYWAPQQVPMACSLGSAC